MYQISKEVQFDMGHRVPNHKSKCRNPHGHRYRVVAYLAAHKLVETPGDSAEGMLADFSDLKALMTEHIHDVLDHGFAIYKEDDEMRSLLVRRTAAGETRFVHDWNVIIFPYIPTAENMARWAFEQLEHRILASEEMGGHLYLHAVEVWETPTSMARYNGPFTEVVD